MKDKPLVSVILSTYQEPARYVQQAIESIRTQTYSPFECIVVIDDIKNTAVVSYVQFVAIQDSRIRVYTHESPQGLAACRNKGISLARGEYVALMDADDISLPNRIERQLEWVETRNADVIFSHIEYIDENREVLGTFAPKIKNIGRDIFLRHVFAHPTGFGRRDTFLGEKYDESFKRAQDVDLWLRLYAKGCSFSIVPDVLLQYRIRRSQSITERITKQGNYARFGFKAVRKHFKRFWYRPAFWYFACKWSFYTMLLNFAPRPLLVVLVHIKDAVLHR